MPSQNPAAAGRKDQVPRCADCSMAGSSRLQMEAATMTPAAKPVRARWTSELKVFRMKKTQAAPKVVPAKGMSSPFQSSRDIAFSYLR